MKWDEKKERSAYHQEDVVVVAHLGGMARTSSGVQCNEEIGDV